MLESAFLSAPNWGRRPNVLSFWHSRLANERHNAVRAVWNDLYHQLAVDVHIAGEFAPFGAGDDRRVDGLIAGVPGLEREVGVDYMVTAVATATGIDNGKDVDLGAAEAAEGGKRRGRLAGRRMELDMQAAGFGFVPVVHETTGAIGREAQELLLRPLFKRLQEEDGLRQQVEAAFALRAAELPWNCRSVRGFFLRRVGVAIARGVGGALGAAKSRGRQAVRRDRIAAELAARVAGRGCTRCSLSLSLSMSLSSSLPGSYLNLKPPRRARARVGRAAGRVGGVVLFAFGRFSPLPAFRPRGFGFRRLPAPFFPGRFSCPSLGRAFSLFKFLCGSGLRDPSGACAYACTMALDHGMHTGST